MTKMHVIHYNGNIFVFHNKNDELTHMFIDRSWFIAKNYKNFTNQFDYLQNLSEIYINTRYLKVTYDQNIMDELTKCV